MTHLRTDWTREVMVAIFDLVFTERLSRRASVYRANQPTVGFETEAQQ